MWLPDFRGECKIEAAICTCACSIWHGCIHAHIGLEADVGLELARSTRVIARQWIVVMKGMLD